MKPIFFLQINRCLDSSAGYLFHDPDICSQIVIACACLHNICIDNNLAMEHDDADEDDAFAPVQMPLDQPAQFVQPNEHLAARGLYVRDYFVGPFDEEDIE